MGSGGRESNQFNLTKMLIQDMVFMPSLSYDSILLIEFSEKDFFLFPQMSVLWQFYYPRNLQPKLAAWEEHWFLFIV